MTFIVVVPEPLLVKYYAYGLCSIFSFVLCRYIYILLHWLHYSNYNHMHNIYIDRYYKNFLSMDYLFDIFFVPFAFPFKILHFLYKVLLHIFRLLFSFCIRSEDTSQILYDEHAPIKIWKIYPLCCYCSSSYVLYNFYKPFSKKLRYFKKVNFIVFFEKISWYIWYLIVSRVLSFDFSINFAYE